jgi:flagellar FliJ protein
MSVFRFHLQKIVDLKEKEKEQTEWALGRSIQREKEEEEKLTRLSCERDEVTRQMAAFPDGNQSIASLREINLYLQSLDRKIKRQHSTLNDCRRETEQWKLQLTHRMQDVKLWNRLREKAEEGFEYLERVKEQKELDEVGISRYLRHVKHS